MLTATSVFETEDEEASAMRPVDIEQDMREMERRKRVDAIMSSKLFREELERVVSDSLRESGADGISNLLSDMMSVRQGGGAGQGGDRDSCRPWQARHQLPTGTEAAHRTRAGSPASGRTPPWPADAGI